MNPKSKIQNPKSADAFSIRETIVALAVFAAVLVPLAAQMAVRVDNTTKQIVDPSATNFWAANPVPLSAVTNSLGSWTGSTNLVNTAVGTLGSAATNSASAFAPATGSTNYAPVTGSTNYATSAQGTLAINALQPHTPIPGVWSSEWTFMPNVYKKWNASQASNATLRVLFVGDSLMAGQQNYLRQLLVDIYGDAGQSYGYLAVSATAGGAAAPSADYTRWINGIYYNLPSAGSITWKNNTTDPILGDTIKVAYLKESGGGTFKIQSSIDGGTTWVDETTGIDASNATTICAIASVTTKSNPSWYCVRVVGTSGTVKILNAQVLNAQTRGVCCMTTAFPGLGIDSMATTPSAIVSPIMADFAPDLVIYLNNDNLDTTSLTTFYNNIRAGYSANDWIFEGLHPQGPTITGNQTSEVQNPAIKAFALSVGQSYFDGYSWGGTFAKLYAAGYTNDDIHLSPNGYSYEASMLLAQSPLLYVANQSPWAASRPAFQRNYNATYWNNSSSGAGNSFFLRKSPNVASEITLQNADNSTTSGFRIKGFAANDGTKPGAVSIFTGSNAEALTLGLYGWLGIGTASVSSYALEIARRNGATQVVIRAPAAGDPGGVYDAVNVFSGSTGSTMLCKIDGYGNFIAAAIGAGIKIKEGSNARMGVATLVAGTVTVSNTSVTANTRIQLTIQSLGTVTAPKAIGITARSAGTSFTITSADATDTSVVAWELIEPAP